MHADTIASVFYKITGDFYRAKIPVLEYSSDHFDDSGYFSSISCALAVGHIELQEYCYCKYKSDGK